MADVLIRGLDVPKNCATCNRDLAAAVNCIYTQRLVLPTEHDMNAGRHPACPILPIPEIHGRLIDADDLDVDEVYTTEYGFQNVVWADLVDSAPTIIPADEVFTMKFPATEGGTS